MTDNIQRFRNFVQDMTALVERRAGDEAALLESIERSTAPNGPAGDEMDLLIFDGVSELTVSLGNDRSLRFLRRATRSLEAGARMSLFVIRRGYHDERSEQMVKELFSRRLVYDASGLKLDRSA